MNKLSVFVSYYLAVFTIGNSVRHFTDFKPFFKSRFPFTAHNRVNKIVLFHIFRIVKTDLRTAENNLCFRRNLFQHIGNIKTDLNIPNIARKQNHVRFFQKNRTQYVLYSLINRVFRHLNIIRIRVCFKRSYTKRSMNIFCINCNKQCFHISHRTLLSLVYRCMANF